MSRLLRALTALAVLLIAGCAAQPSGTGSGAAPTLSISSPANGTAVSLPFTVQLESNVTLADPETGEHHVLVFIDGNDSEYLLVYGDHAEVTELPVDLPPGRHVLSASLRHADHSAAGVEAQVEVEIRGGGAPAVGGAPGGDYGY
jgi:hypothetical protein